MNVKKRSFVPKTSSKARCFLNFPLGNKKAQFFGRPVVWIIAVIMIAMILFFGYRAITKSIQTGCLVQLTLFEKRLISDLESMYNQEGSVVEKDYIVPCGVEKIYFVDIDKDVSFSSLSNYPEIMDNVKSGTEKNVFMIKGNKVYDSFSADIEIAYPYYDCYITKNGALGLFLEGKAGKTGILKKNNKFDCTFTGPIPVELSLEDLVELLDEIGEDFDLEEDCNITRTITVKEGETIVSIKNCDEDNVFFEKIPKCALEVLNDLGVINLNPDEVSLIESDPLIMWNFMALEEKIYEIKKAIEENCKREFKGVAFDEEIGEVSSFDGIDLEGISNALSNIHPSLEGQFNLVQNQIKKYQDDTTDTAPLIRAVERIDSLLDEDMVEGSMVEGKLENLKTQLELLIP